MKVCYCDESGTGDEPIAVMVGVIVDAQRMHVTKNDWKELLIVLSKVAGTPIKEIHTRDFYSGNGVWRSITGDKRSIFITTIFDWLKKRRHDVVHVSVDKNKYHESLKTGLIKEETKTLWRFMGLHLLLCVQKVHQKLSKTKGHTIFIFDNEERERMRFTDMIAHPPAWADSYYGKKKKQEQLDQIVDVPYFGDSEEVYLLQLADFIAFFLRRHLEISGGYSKEKYDDEGKKIAAWMNELKECSFPPSVAYPAVGRCSCAKMFYEHAPEIARTLGRV
jgi:hypothetical protein